MDDRKILDSYPLPIARSWLRCRNAAEVRDRHDAAYYLFEIYLKYLACIAIASYLAGKERDHPLNAVLKGLARPSIGEWVRFLRECLKFLASRPDANPAMKALMDFFQERDLRSPAARELFNEMRASRTGEPSRKEHVGPEALLGEAVAYRNRILGHGAPLGPEHYRKFGDLFAAAFEDLLRLSPFLTAHRLVSFDAIEVRDGSRVECRILEYMGQQAVRRQQPLVLPYGERLPIENTLYLMREDGALTSLDPLLIPWRDDVYFLNEASGTPEYLSYSTGDRHRPSSLQGAQGELFERILGYEVDEKKLSQIGDDLDAAARAMAKPALLEGEHRLGDYRIIREIGRGAMGAVFEAVQESLGRRVALKILPGTFALDPRRVERFHREARATARIHHPNVVPVFEVGEIEGNHYYTMEFLGGLSLDRFIGETREASLKRDGRRSSSATEANYIAHAALQFAALADGLEAAHKLGLIHRDIKPSNIIIDSGGKYVLVDFGLVHESGADTLTRSGELIGTLTYMSPEQISRSELDPRSDVYSLGASFYEVLTLRPPCRLSSEIEIQKSILFEEPPPARKLNPRIHRDLETILLKAMEKHPDRRYASAGELAADLRRFLRYEPIRARPQTAVTRLARRAWRSRARIAAVAGSLLLLVSASLLAFKWRGEAAAAQEGAYRDLVLGAVMSMPLGGIGAREEDEVWPDPIRKAITDLKEAEAIFPKRAEAYYHRARGLHFMRRNREAIEELDRALASDDGFIPARALRDLIGRSEPAAPAAGPTPGEQSPVPPPATAAPPPAASGPGPADGEAAWGAIWLEAQRAMLRKEWQAAIRAYTELLDSHGRILDRYLGLAIEARLGRGRAYLEARKYDDALVEIGAVEALWPKMIEPALLLGKIFSAKGNPEKAHEKFLDLLARHPSPEEVALGAAGVFHASGNYRLGLEWLEKMKKVRRREIQRSDFLRHLGRLDESIAAAEGVLKEEGEYPEAYNSIGNCLVRQDRFEDAAARFSRAIQIDPSYVWAYNNLGIALKNLNRLDEAIASYRKAIAMDPEYSQAHYNLAVALQQQGKTVEAEGSLRRALEIDDGYALAQSLLGNILLEGGKLDDAIAALRRAVEIDAANLGAAFRLTLAMEQKGDVEGALARCRDILENFEKSEEAGRGGPIYSARLGMLLNHLADLELKSGKSDRAREHRRRYLVLLQEATRDPKAVPTVLNERAWALLTCEPGDLQDAAAALELALRAVELTASRQPDILDTLALAYFKNGNTAKAIETEKLALSLIPEGSGDAENQARRKQLEESLASFEKAAAASR